MERHEHLHKSRIEIFFNNFLGGIAWGLGATVGVSIFFAIFAFILNKINLIPVIGGFVSDIARYVLQNNPHLLTK
jgi:hypothetical protein